MLTTWSGCLNPYSNGMLTQNEDPTIETTNAVLILILMECLLSVFKTIPDEIIICLNPYSNGMLTQISFQASYNDYPYLVLILILMECLLRY